jgi:hypothetical protein
MGQSYRMRLNCLQRGCDYYEWTVRENLSCSLKDVYDKSWDFICPSHGPQQTRPFQAEVKTVLVVLPPPTSTYMQ